MIYCRTGPLMCQNVTNTPIQQEGTKKAWKSRKWDCWLEFHEGNRGGPWTDSRQWLCALPWLQNLSQCWQSGCTELLQATSRQCPMCCEQEEKKDQRRHWKDQAKHIEILSPSSTCCTTHHKSAQLEYRISRWMCKACEASGGGLRRRRWWTWRITFLIW